MKKILSLFLALIMVGSTLIFCAAETEIKVDVRLEENKDGFVDMVFSLPENSDLAEFSFEVFYYAPDVVAQYLEEDPFKSNLSAEEEANVEWTINRDQYAGDKDYGLRPRVLVSGYTKDGNGLNKGGDFFTITFTKINGITEDLGFNIVTNYLVTSDGEAYTDATVPATITCLVENDKFVDYYVSYEKLVMTDSMETIIDQTKLAAEYSGDNYGAAGRSAGALPNSTTASDATNLSGGSDWSGAAIPIQPFKAKDEFVRYLKTHITVSSANYFNFRWRTNAAATNDSSQIVFSNNQWANTGTAWHQMDIAGFQVIPVASTTQQYYLTYGWVHPSIAGSGNYYVNDVSNNRTYQWRADGLYTMENQIFCFAVSYDENAKAFRTAVNNLGSSAAATNAYKSLLNTASSKYSTIDSDNVRNNTRVASLKSTYDARLSSYNSAVTTAANNWVTSVNNLASGGLTNAEISTLTTLRTNYNNLCDDAKAKSNVKSALTVLTNMEGAESVVSAISGLTVNWANRSTVTSNYNSYNGLASGPKGYVPSDLVTKITNGKSTIDGMTTAYNDAVSAANAIPDTVDINNTDTASKITAARNAYNTAAAYGDSGLNSDLSSYLTKIQSAENRLTELQTQVDNFKTAVGGLSPGDRDAVASLLSTYNGFTDGQKALVADEYSKLTVDYPAAFNVMDLIDAIGTVDLDKADEIATAKEAYEALNDAQKAMIPDSYKTKLTTAESDLANIQVMVNDLIDRINTIGDVDLNDEELIVQLVGEYNNLTDIQKSAVTNSADLTTAAEKIADLKLRVSEFIALVESIGQVDVDDLNTIVSAETLYGVFTDGQKALVETQYQTLLTARQRIDVMIGEVEALDIQISTTIPETDVDVDSADAVNAANAIYNTFTDAQKELLENEQILLDAIDAVAAAQAKVAAVETAIKNIGGVTYAKKAIVENVRAEFDNLTDAQQEAVSNVATLLAAEEKIAQFEAEITAVEELINAIGDVDIDKEDAINSAVNALNGLSQAQKDVVENIDLLTSAQEALQSIKDMIDAFEEEIEAIYPIDIDDGSVIAAAEAKFDALTEPQKGAVENHIRLTNARATYDQMSADVADFKSTVNGLGEVDLWDEDIEAVSNAQTVYESFTDLQKAEVETEKVLLDDAADTLDVLWQEVYALIDAIDAIGEVTVEDEFAILDCINTYEEMTEGQKSRVENLSKLLAAEEELNAIKEANSLYGVIVASNNLASTQTVTLNLNAYNAVAGYYFGTSADYNQNERVDTTATSDTKEITDAGTYYLNVFDANENVSEAVMVTFVDVVLDAKGGEVGVTNLLVKMNNYIALPTATKDGDTFMGWARNEDSVTGETIVDVENGGIFYAVWAGENKPSLKVVSTNNVATKQTLTLSSTAGEDIVGYYFGTSAFYGENSFTETNQKVSTIDVFDAGIYYITVLDVQGNISATIPVTFYKITLDANGGNVAIPYVIIKAGNSIDLPEAINIGHQYLGWSADVGADYGIKTVTPTESVTYFALWTRGVSVSADVGSITGAKAGDRVYIPVSMDRYSNSYASIAINNVIFDKAVLSFVEFSVPENDFINHLSQAPVINNARKTYKIVNNPENAVDAYYTSTGVFVILVFDVLQDVNQYTSVSVGFDSKNTSVFTMGSLDSWTETASNVDVTVANGGVNAIIDNQKPGAIITSTNNISAIQTVTLNMFDNMGVAGYYFGINADYANNQYFTDGVSVSKKVNTAGSYYLTVVDIYGNISDTVSVTFFSITLITNADAPAEVNLLIKEGNELELPVYEKSGYTFKGWAKNNDATEGEFSITATADQVLYGTWKSSEEEIQYVEDLISALGEITLDSADEIVAARLAYEALTDEQKVLVENYGILEAAEEVIITLGKIIGDVNQNGVTEATDALLVLHDVVGKIDLTDEQLVIADVDENGVVNAVDALYILHISVGKIIKVK